jgi:Zn-dependent protease with chaperone function
MIAAVVFALYAAAAGVLAPALLRGPWAARSPRLALGLWLAVPVSWVAAVVLAVLAAMAPVALSWSGSSGAGWAQLARSAAPGGRVIAVAGLVASAAVVLWAAGCMAREVHRDWRAWRGHAALVAAVGRPGDEPGVAIIDHDVPAVYCLPSGRYRIVVSGGAVRALSPEQVRVVLAHERAHLRCRHHLVLTLATALGRAFPCVPLLASAPSEVAVLSEMAADDAAARRHSRDDLAAALVVLARARAKPAMLAAGGPAASARLERILAPQQPRPGLARLAAVTGLIPAVAIACLPLMLAACDIASHP